MEQYLYQKPETNLTSFTHDVIINAYDFTCKRFIDKYKDDVTSKPVVYQPLLDCAYTLINGFFFTNWAIYVNGRINGDIRVTINALHGDDVSTLDDIKKEFQLVYVLVGSWSFLQENDAPPPRSQSLSTFYAITINKFLPLSLKNLKKKKKHNASNL